MINIRTLKAHIYKSKASPVIIVLFALLFAASVAFALTPDASLPQNRLEDNKSTSTHLVSQERKDDTSEEKQAEQEETKKDISQTPKNVSSKKVLGASANLPTPPTVVSPSANNQSATTLVSDAQGSAQTNSSPHTRQSVSPTNTPAPVISTVQVEVKTPDSASNVSVAITDGMNVCDILQKAKDEGKISSLAFDDSYLSTYKSRYVYEMNGYRNNWTFTVNGTSPLGCSLYNPKPNDTIVWKFL